MQKCEFVDSNNQIVLQDLAYVQKTPDFVLDLVKSHGLDPASAFIRISLDGGGSFFKVIINVFDCEEKNGLDLFLNSGVQQSEFLAIVEDIPELNCNLRHIIEKLTLQDVSYYVAFDLKCGNALFGLSEHSGKRACLWFEGIFTLESGTKRTLGSIDYWYCKYVENKSVNSSKKIVYLDLDPDTLIEHLVPPPELHLLIGFICLARVR